MRGFVVIFVIFIGVNSQEQLSLEECFDKYERGIYPHPDDCGQFLSCATAEPLECPAGLHFNPVEFVCDWPANAGCLKVTTPNPDMTTSEGTTKIPNELEKPTDSPKDDQKPTEEQSGSEPTSHNDKATESPQIETSDKSTPSSDDVAEETSAKEDSTEPSDSSSLKPEATTLESSTEEKPSITSEESKSSTEDSKDTPASTEKSSTDSSESSTTPLDSSPSDSSTTSKDTTTSASSTTKADSSSPATEAPTSSAPSEKSEESSTETTPNSSSKPSDSPATQGSTEHPEESSKPTTPEPDSSSKPTEAASTPSSSEESPKSTTSAESTQPDSPSTSSDVLTSSGKPEVSPEPSTPEPDSSNKPSEAASTQSPSEEPPKLSTPEPDSTSKPPEVVSSTPSSSEEAPKPAETTDSPTKPSDTATTPSDPEKPEPDSSNKPSEAPSTQSPPEEPPSEVASTPSSSEEAPKPAETTKPSDTATTPSDPEKPESSTPAAESTKADEPALECEQPNPSKPCNAPPQEPTTKTPIESRFKETTPEDLDGIYKEPLTQPPPTNELSLKDCLRKYKFGIFPHPGDPTKFYICTKTAPREMTCPPGLEFDGTSFSCGRPPVTTQPPPPMLGLRDCFKEHPRGVFGHSTDCAKYYVCSRRGPIEMICPMGLNFNPMKLTCDWPSRHCISPDAKVRDQILRTMKADRIVPDLLDQCPNKLAEGAFPSGAQVHLGQEITPSQALQPPRIYWEADKRSLYTLCMVDPDAPRTKEAPNQWNHWTVGNIPGNQINQGQSLFQYLPPCPAKNSAPHRYTYMVFKQPQRINFQQPPVPATSFQNRDGFNLRHFVDKYQLGQPIAGNYFKCRWDRSVPQTLNQLKSFPKRFTMILKPFGSFSYSYSVSRG